MKESADGTVINDPSDSPIVDHDGTRWRLAPNGLILINGYSDGSAPSKAEELVYSDELIWYRDHHSMWRSRAGFHGQWSDGTTTAPVITGDIKALLLALDAKVERLLPIIGKVDTLMATLDEAIANAQAGMVKGEASEAAIIGLLETMSASMKDLAAQVADLAANQATPEQTAAVQAIADQAVADAATMDAAIAAAQAPPAGP